MYHRPWEFIRVWTTVQVRGKSYNDLRKTLAAANMLFVVVWLGLAYAFVLTPSHKQVLYGVFNTIKVDPFWGSLLTMALLASAWGFITSFLVRLHDRLYEPHLVNWRASYESDNILRSQLSRLELIDLRVGRRKPHRKNRELLVHILEKLKLI